jgi:hypothetical protein
MSVQISAYIEEGIKERMESYAAAHGLKKGYLIENALDSYLNALYEIPSSMMVPGMISVSEETFETLIESENKEPTAALKALMQYD